jgi:hypothetical protein
MVAMTGVVTKPSTLRLKLLAARFQVAQVLTEIWRAQATGQSFVYEFEALQRMPVLERQPNHDDLLAHADRQVETSRRRIDELRPQALAAVAVLHECAIAVAEHIGTNAAREQCERLLRLDLPRANGPAENLGTQQNLSAWLDDELSAAQKRVEEHYLQKIDKLLDLTS